MIRFGIAFFQKIKSYLFHGMWHKPNSERSPFTRFVVNQLKILFITIRNFMEDKVALKASALTYYSLLSVVPILALAFGIAKGFGFKNLLESKIRNNLHGQEEVINWVISFANKMLISTKGGLIAGIGLVVLIWSVMKVLGNIERAFNDIWQINKGRTFYRKFSDYLSIVLIAPIFVLISSSITVYLSTHVELMDKSSKIIGLIYYLLNSLLLITPYLLIWLLFVFLYMVIPNTKVKFGPALVASILAGTGFQLSQWLYLKFQIYVSNYNAVYGSFAALPLFMIWLQLSWLIVLFGAELAYASQNLKKIHDENLSLRVSSRSKRILSLVVVSYLSKRFKEGLPPATLETLSNDLDIPRKICTEIVSKLNDANILSEITNQEGFTSYQPALDINLLTIKYVVDKQDLVGVQFEQIVNLDEYKKVEAHLKAFDELVEQSNSNILLKNL